MGKQFDDNRFDGAVRCFLVVSSSGGSGQGLVSSEVGPSVALPATSVVPPHSSAGVGLPAGFTQQVGQMITVPPPTHVSMPPPTLHIPTQMAPPQVCLTSAFRVFQEVYQILSHSTKRVVDMASLLNMYAMHSCNS